MEEKLFSQTNIKNPTKMLLLDTTSNESFLEGISLWAKNWFNKNLNPYLWTDAAIKNSENILF